MKHFSKNLEDTKRVADEFLAHLMPEEKAMVVALEGDLGAGKTTFTQEVGRILGIEESIQSPTFVIMKIYEIDWQGFKRLIHIDAYRLDKESELLHLGWEEMVKNPENLIFIEWPENVPRLISKEAKRISLNFIDETSREIHLHED